MKRLIIFLFALALLGSCNKKAETAMVSKSGFEPSEIGKQKDYEKINPCNLESRDVTCPSIYNPVCGKLKNGKTKTFSNSCTACRDKEVQSWQSTSCEARAKR